MLFGPSTLGHPVVSTWHACPLDGYDWEAPRRFELPGSLQEVSGLAVLDTDRLLAHDDERGIVSILSVADGRVLGRFRLGPKLPRDDFEGIALLDRHLYLVSSGGRLYDTSVGQDGEVVPYRVRDTGIGKECEVEGLDADPAHHALLVACKTPRDRALKGKVTVVRWSVDRAAVLEPMVQIPIAAVTRAKRGDFRPSAVVGLPDGSILLLSGIQRSLLAIGANGAVECARRLDTHHRQPEGLAIMPDGTLVIADEGGGRAAQLTVYRHGTR